MPKRTFWKTSRTLLGCAILMVTALATNCSEQRSAQPVNTRPGGGDSSLQPEPAPRSRTDQPADRPAEPRETQPATRPEAPQPPETKPATAPEAEQPVSTYDSRPPYPVSLYVKDPKEKQPGWLRIEEFAGDRPLATARGRFPEQNRIYVDTTNVRRVRIHVGHLPLRPDERVILQIDGQGMVISRTRPFTTLQLSPTGQWTIVKED